MAEEVFKFAFEIMLPKTISESFMPILLDVPGMCYFVESNDRNRAPALNALKVITSTWDIT